MLICFFDARGIVHKEFLPPGETVNQDYYVKVLMRVREAVRQKRPELWESGEWWFHHNAPALRAVCGNHFPTKSGITLRFQPPHSPDLTPFDFFLFPKMKKELYGRSFADVEEVQRQLMLALKGIRREEFQNCFVQWKSRLQFCLEAEGDHVEVKTFT